MTPFRNGGSCSPSKKIWHHGWNNQDLRWRSPPVGKRNAEMKTPLQTVPYKILGFFIQVFLGDVFFYTKETYVPTPRPWGPPKKFFRSLWSAINCQLAIALRAFHCRKRREVERKFPGFVRFMSLSRKFFLTSPNEGLTMVVIHPPVSVNLACPPVFAGGEKSRSDAEIKKQKDFDLLRKKNWQIISMGFDGLKLFRVENGFLDLINMC